MLGKRTPEPQGCFTLPPGAAWGRLPACCHWPCGWEVRAPPLSLQRHHSPVLATPSCFHPGEQRAKVSPRPGALVSTQIPRKAGVAKPWQERACANYNPHSLLTRGLGLQGGESSRREGPGGALRLPGTWM